MPFSEGAKSKVVCTVAAAKNAGTARAVSGLSKKLTLKTIDINCK